MKKISNFKFQISNSQRGYTLIELLAVMIVMVTVGLIVATILVSALRGNNKTNVISDIRQNGNYAIVQIGRMIEFAQRFAGVSTNGVSYTTNCVGQSGVQYKYVKIIAFDNGETVLSCNFSSNPPTIASGSASLIDTNRVSLSSDCHFTCSQNTFSEAPVVGVSFTLSQKNVSGFFENRASIPFETSVIMRNINK